MICILLVAAGAAWESRALSLLAAESDLTVLKRCVDVDDLLAAAGTGQADVAVVGLDAPGLDVAAVEHLRRYGVRPVAVVPGASGPVPEAGHLHASRLGITGVLAAGELDRLAPVVREDAGRAVGAVDPTGSATAVSREQDGHERPAGTGGGRVVAVWGPAGAPGRTTVACALAATLAARHQHVTLVDADPWGGCVAQQLGVLDEVSGLLSAARMASSGALPDRLTSVQRRLSPTLSLVSGLPRPDRWVEVRAGAVEHLVECLRPAGHVVVDTGFSLEEDPGADFGSRPGRNSMTLGALSVADEVVVVGSADPVGLSRLARGLVELRDVTGGRPVRVVVNHNRSTLAWSEHDIAGMVEGFTRVLGLHFLPEDRSAADQAVVSGRTLPETGDGPLVRAVAELADAVVPASVQSPPRRRRGRAQAAKSR